MMRFGSVCSGIEAASVAWYPLGWRAAWLAEIEAFPAAVLAHHYPDVPNLGDMTQIAAKVMTGQVEAPDVLVGGTPCQAFSVAGMRKGLEDARGQLTIKYVELANAIDHVRRNRGEPPAIIVWENVPGVLSDKGNAFGCFLGALAGEDCELVAPGGKWANAGCVFGPERTIAWRVLDAQYFGVAQRRRRVFLVASARKDVHPAQILFEFDGLRRDSAPRRESQQSLAGTLEASAARSRGAGTSPGFITAVSAIKANSHWDGEQYPHPTINQAHNTGGIGQSNQELFSQRGAGLVSAHGYRMTAFGEYADDESASTMKARDYKDATDLAVMSIHGTQDPDVNIEQAHTLGRNQGQENAVFAFAQNQRDEVRVMPYAGALAAEAGMKQQTYVAQPVYSIPGNADTSHANSGNWMAIQNEMAVRRLTPVECERLQGFPDFYTEIPWRNKPAEECPDGPRYKALGNSMAVPCMAFIGRRIEQLTY